jgi:hypothetical protein
MPLRHPSKKGRRAGLPDPGCAHFVEPTALSGVSWVVAIRSELQSKKCELLAHLPIGLLPVQCIKTGFLSSKKPPPARKPGLSEACHWTFKHFSVVF